MLKQGQPIYVRYQLIEKETPWDPGTVKQVLNNRSHIVIMTQGKIVSIFDNEHVLMGR